jgi:integrase
VEDYSSCRAQLSKEFATDREVRVPELETTVFVLPGWLTKNGEERVVVLNSIARKVIEEARGNHPERVFTYGGRSVTKMYNNAWRKARARAGLGLVRVHDLRHTFGQRLRAAGVPLEDRKALLGHQCDDITTHYSAPELAKLIQHAERVCAERPNTILRLTSPAKVPQKAPQNAKLLKGLLSA